MLRVMSEYTVNSLMQKQAIAFRVKDSYFTISDRRQLQRHVLKYGGKCSKCKTNTLSVKLLVFGTEHSCILNCLSGQLLLSKVVNPEDS